MSLSDWQKAGWLTGHKTSPQEIADLRLNIAYNAALQVATAALAAAGYRAAREAHHYRVIQSLAYTLGAESKVVSQLEQFRKKRNVGGYERAGSISDQEAAEMLAL